MTLSHSPNIVRDGLVLYLDAANTKSYPGTGTAWYDLSGNGNTFTLVGSPTFSNNSFLIPNSNAVYALANSPTNFNQGTSSFTLSMWWKQNDSGYNVACEARGDSLVGYFFVANYTSAGKMAVFVNASGAQSVYTSTRSDLPINESQNICVVVNRATSTAKFYLNGDLWDTKTSIHANTISPSTGSIYRIGYDRGGSTANFDVYSYQHYGRPLTDLEIKQNFNALRGRYGI